LKQAVNAWEIDDVNDFREKWGLRIVKGKPERRYCVFNKTRESLLSLNVTSADTHFARLKGLIGKLRLRSDEGLWVTPSNGIHSIGLLFPIDLIYLDADNRVLHLTESFGTFRIGPILMNCCSVLELASRSIYCSQTQVGDEFLICTPEELEEYLEAGSSGARNNAQTRWAGDNKRFSGSGRYKKNRKRLPHAPDGRRKVSGAGPGGTGSRYANVVSADRAGI
jgi:uncharacterized protein